MPADTFVYMICHFCGFRTAQWRRVVIGKARNDLPVEFPWLPSPNYKPVNSWYTFQCSVCSMEVTQVANMERGNMLNREAA